MWDIKNYLFQHRKQFFGLFIIEITSIKNSEKKKKKTTARAYIKKMEPMEIINKEIFGLIFFLFYYFFSWLFFFCFFIIKSTFFFAFFFRRFVVFLIFLLLSSLLMHSKAVQRTISCIFFLNQDRWYQNGWVENNEFHRLTMRTTSVISIAFDCLLPVALSLSYCSFSVFDCQWTLMWRLRIRASSRVRYLRPLIVYCLRLWLCISVAFPYLITGEH